VSAELVAAASRLPRGPQVALKPFTPFQPKQPDQRNGQGLADLTIRISPRCHTVIVPAIQERLVDRVPLGRLWKTQPICAKMSL